MDLIQEFIDKARKNPAKIVFPEGSDERIMRASVKAKEMAIAEPVLLGDKEEIKKIASAHNLLLEGIPVISPRENDYIEKYAKIYAAARGIREVIARKLVRKPLAFAGMMVKTGDAGGMVAGVSSATASVIQAASLTIGFAKGLSVPSSFFIMVIPHFRGEKDKSFIFADCAVNISPDSKQLAEIGITSGINAKILLGIEPKIAFLSFSTKGTGNHDDVEKVIQAVNLAKNMNSGFEIDGELQADSAIVPSVAEKKVKESGVAGNANVLVFPDLDAGNICYKLVQYLAGARAVGPILQGFAKPVNDLSRGASVDDIIAVTAITTIQSQNEL